MPFKLSLLSVLVITGVNLTQDSRAATKSAPESAHEISIPNTRQVEFVSKVNGHRYVISVAMPFMPAPAQGYPVLYVIDGFAYFASAAEVVRLWNAPQVLVVGIDYPRDAAWVENVRRHRGPFAPGIEGMPPAAQAAFYERLYDLTLPARDDALAADAFPDTPPAKSANVGGLEDFLKTIETEIKPRVAALARVDTTNQVLFGHSLGGLATLHALFTEPKAFRTFLIASPSIWWNQKSVLTGGPAFAEKLRSGQAAPRVLVTIGGKESTLPKSAGKASDVAATENYFRRIRMVDNAQELATWLKEKRGGAGYRVADFAVFDEITHGLAAWPALARGVAFAFSPDEQ